MMDKCETCVWYVYDEDYDDYICDMDLDEDELARFLAADTRSCPYWRPGLPGVPACSAEKKHHPLGGVSFRRCRVRPHACGGAAAPRCRCSLSAPLPRRAAAPRPPASFCQQNVVSFAFEPSLTLGELL